MSAKRTCKCGCGHSIEHKHPNAKFLNKRHKDKYWNWVNPRGKFAHLAEANENYDPGDDEYWSGKDF